MKKAMLMMESWGTVPNVRGSSISPVWSRLYRGHNYVMDLVYRPGPQEGVLEGQILVTSGHDLFATGSVTVYDSGGALAEAELDYMGQFQIKTAGRPLEQLFVQLDSGVDEFLDVQFPSTVMSY